MHSRYQESSNSTSFKMNIIINNKSRQKSYPSSGVLWRKFCEDGEKPPTLRPPWWYNLSCMSKRMVGTLFPFRSYEHCIDSAETPNTLWLQMPWPKTTQLLLSDFFSSCTTTRLATFLLISSIRGTQEKANLTKLGMVFKYPSILRREKKKLTKSELSDRQDRPKFDTSQLRNALGRQNEARLTMLQELKQLSQS